MNRKVLLTMIVLLWVFLFAFMAIKLFLPNELVAVVENEQILKIGAFIDNNTVVRLLADTLLSVLSLHFYLCACKRTWKLSPRWYLALTIYACIGNACYLVNPYIAMSIDITGLVLLPFLLKSDTSQTVAIFILHQMAQPITLTIRSEPLYLASTNYATQLMLVFDLYIWLTLYYLYSNLYKEESLWEKLVCPFLAISRKLSLRKKLQK